MHIRPCLCFHGHGLWTRTKSSVDQGILASGSSGCISTFCFFFLPTFPFPFTIQGWVFPNPCEAGNCLPFTSARSFIFCLFSQEWSFVLPCTRIPGRRPGSHRGYRLIRSCKHVACRPCMVLFWRFSLCGAFNLEFLFELYRILAVGDSLTRRIMMTINCRTVYRGISGWYWPCQNQSVH